MSLKSDRARIEKIIYYIDCIETIINNHNHNIQKALEMTESQFAIMHCLTQIGEILNKIESSEYRNRLPIKHATALRNIIVHDYDGINLSSLENTLSVSIPQLKKTIQDLL